jgi:hypothetical protein
MKRLCFVLIVLVVLTTLGFFFFRQPGVDSTGKIHADLYTGASETWNPDVQVLPFHAVEVDGQTVGSSTAIRLEWSKPTQPYNHFLLTITNTTTQASTKESGEHERVSLDVTGLTPDTEYVFALQACLDPRCDEWIVADTETPSRTPAEIWSTDEVPVLLNP